MHEELMERVKNRLDMLQHMMENQIHLTEGGKVIDQIASITTYWTHLSDEDKDYIHGCQYALEEQIQWSLVK